MRRQARHEILSVSTQHRGISVNPNSSLKPYSAAASKPGDPFQKYRRLVCFTSPSCGILQWDQLVKNGDGFLNQADYRTMSSDGQKIRNYHFRFLQWMLFCLKIHQFRLYVYFQFFRQLFRHKIGTEDSDFCWTINIVTQ